MAQLPRRLAYLRMIHGVSAQLSASNIKSIVFLTDLGRLEPAATGETERRGGLEVLQSLWRKDFFSETRLEPLESLLREIQRNDLLGNYLEEFKSKYPADPTPFEDFDDNSSWQPLCRSCSSYFPEGGQQPPLPEQRIKSSSVCIMTASTPGVASKTSKQFTEDSEDEIVLSPAEFSELLTHVKTEETALSGSLQKKIKCFKHSPTSKCSIQRSPIRKQRRSSSNSDASSIASSYTGNKRNSSTSFDVGYSSSPQESHDMSHDMKHGLLCSDSEPVGSPDTEGEFTVQPSTKPATPAGWTVSWKLKRADLLPIIFNHKISKCFEKKIRVTVGKRSEKNNIDILLKLYPYGIDGDRNTACSIQVEVTRNSKPPPSDSGYLLLDIQGFDTKDNTLIVSRQAESSLAKKTFVISEFLSHEIVKCSMGKYFDFRITLRVKYSVSNDWVYVNTAQTDS